MYPQQPQEGPDPILGQTIGNYVVKQKLGEGGMGSVYLAEHPHIGKKVALKVLHAEYASNHDVVSRFFNEAKAVNDIQHPNIVDIVDYGVMAAGPTGDQLVYFIMEFLPGGSLSDLLRRESPLAPERSLAICLQVADALTASHKCGIVHRDLKPDNIMLIQRGRERDFVKLLDFGIAKLTGDQPGSRRTRTGIVMGTPAYMSPEQCEGRGNIDHRTDVYALGIVLYEMLTGRVPFLGEGYGEILVQHLTQLPTAPSTFRGINPHVEQVVLKALEKRPDARYPTMEEFSRALMDPVGYVEANGGLEGFRAKALQASDAPLEAPSGRFTPSPLTPVPGSLAGVGSGAVPTTLGGSNGQVAPGGSGKKVGLFVGLGVVVAGAAVGAALVLTGGKSSDSPAPAAGSAVATPGDGAGTGAATNGAGSGTGSAMAAGPGTAATPPPALPDAAPAEVKAEKVTITVESTPPGAEVFVAAETAPRGKTPLSFELDKATSEVEVRLVLGKHKVETRSIKLDANQNLDIALEKERSGGRPGGGSTSRDKPPAGGETTKPKGGGDDKPKGGGDDKPRGGGDDGGEDDTMNPFARKKAQ